MNPFYRFPFIIDNKALGKSELWPKIRDATDTSGPEMDVLAKKLLEEVAKPREDSANTLSQSFGEFFKG